MTIGRSIIAAFILAVAGLTAASAEDQSLLELCWTPEALTHAEKELKPGRSGARFDLAALKEAAPDAATPVPPELRGSIRSVELPPGEKLIALTFDLCESGGTAGYDGRIADLLRAQGVKATFFASGKWLETHPERAQQLIADPNFEIGAHGLRHLDLSRVSSQAVNEEITLPEAAYARARNALLARQCASDAAPALSPPPERMTLMRFPYGRCNANSLAAAAEAGQLAIQWDVVSGDPDPRTSAKTIANTILTRAHPGAIVVAHANGRGRNTAAALALALPKLKEQGYSFVTVSELLAAGKPVITAKCYLNNPRDMTRIARKSRKRSHDSWTFLPRKR
ncbi:MAG: polysaccharide deacetylase family protein [Phycisphaeraceae bacterium]